MRRIAPCLAVFVAMSALTVSTTAQRGVIPPNLAATYGGGEGRSFGSSNDYHGQAIYDQHRLPGDLTPGKFITAVGVRTAERYPNQLTCTFETEVWLYSCSTSSSTMTLDFAANVAGASGGLVFARRPLNLPAHSTVIPRRGFRMVPLDTPHAFRGPNLCFEFEHYPPNTSAGIFSDYCNIGANGYGSSWGVRCGTGRWTISGGSFSPGRRTGFQLYNGPAFGTVFNLISLQGHPPLDLTPIGMQGCTLYVGTEMMQIVTLDWSGMGTAFLRIPNLPSVEGVPLYSQFIVPDLQANPLGLALTGAYGVVIGGPAVCGGMGLVFRSGSYFGGPAPTVPILGVDYH